MTNIEITAIHTALRLARERCESEGVSSPREMETIALCSIENFLSEINQTPRDEWPTLMGSYSARKWLVS